jgi:hypothetical protein
MTSRPGWASRRTLSTPGTAEAKALAPSASATPCATGAAKSNCGSTPTPIRSAEPWLGLRYPSGTWGKIRTEQLGPNRHRARARFRDYDGVTRDVEATGPTGPAAIRALQTKLRDRIAPNDDEVTRETLVNTLADLWLAEIIAEERITAQAIDRYTASLRIVIRPAIGNLRLREATVGRLDKMLRTVAADRPSLAKNAKVAPGQMFGLGRPPRRAHHQPRTRDRPNP